ncbi:hypothetical protein Golomagni_07219 [Golovinomyces magnicellulatus]|nr:hypothetical protein Golomagni_07219 [Golovinomyces magnicellulatus]
MKNGVKRNFHDRDALGNKKSKPNSGTSLVKRDLLQQHYQYVQTLREYLLEKLPGTSRLRRRKIANLGNQQNSDNIQDTLSRLLDTCLVCFDEREQEQDPARWEQWVSFSQRADESYVTLSGGISAAIFSQSEIVDFCIWLLFSRESVAGRWPKHLICDGFRRTKQDGNHVSSTIPGIFQYFPNASVVALKDIPWTQVLALLGQSGERIMIDLLVDCSVFLEVESGYRNYYQLNGRDLLSLPDWLRIDLNRFSSI